MHQELIRELAVISEEEQRILDGQKGIDQHIYTEKKDMVIDSRKLLRRRSARLRRDSEMYYVS